MFLTPSKIISSLTFGLLLVTDRLHTSIATSNNDNDADTLTSNLIQWVRDSGGYVSDKIVFRHINDTDPTSPRGVFALRDIDEGETLAIIPWDIIIKSPDKEDGKVKAGEYSKDDCAVIEATRKAMAASDDDITPYGKYLLSQPQNYTVGFWTEGGHALMVELTGGTGSGWTVETDNTLPPTDIDDQLIYDFGHQCGGDLNDPLAVQAAMLVRARSDYEYMVPIYDMFNHDNGNYNIRHKFNPYTSSIIETGYGVITSRKIHAGEELYNSYNRCSICDGYLDWFGTPEVYLHYGFVENYPQRWLFDLARVKVDLTQDDNNEVKVKFLVPPSKKGVDMLRNEIMRLDQFAIKYRHESYGKMGMRSMEWTSLWEYFDAIHTALTLVTETTETLVDDVWSMGDSWWVQESSEAHKEEHKVRLLIRDEF